MLDVKGIPQLERLFRLAAELDVDKRRSLGYRVELLPAPSSSPA